jgi:hypothetical protein
MIKQEKKTNNAIALLEECIINGDLGIEHLWAWYQGERHLIKQTVLEARFEEKETEKWQ